MMRSMQRAWMQCYSESRTLVCVYRKTSASYLSRKSDTLDSSWTNRAYILYLTSWNQFWIYLTLPVSQSCSPSSEGPSITFLAPLGKCTGAYVRETKERCDLGMRKRTTGSFRKSKETSLITQVSCSLQSRPTCGSQCWRIFIRPRCCDIPQDWWPRSPHHLRIQKIYQGREELLSLWRNSSSIYVAESSFLQLITSLCLDSWVRRNQYLTWPL